MLQAALFFTPLLAGYVFAVTWKYSCYYSAREDSQRIYFRAAYYGVFLFLYAVLSTLLVRVYFPTTFEVLGQFLQLVLPSAFFKPAGNDPAITSQDLAQIIFLLIATLIWGSCLGFMLNYLYAKWQWLRKVFWSREETAIAAWGPLYRKLVQERGDDLELLLFRALEKTMPVLVTMANRKVYVGMVVELMEPHLERKNLRLLPLLSGYRREDNHEVDFTTSYQAIYEEILTDSKDGDSLDPEGFEIVLPCALIQSLSLFDITTYLRFSQQEEAEAGQEERSKTEIARRTKAPGLPPNASH